jgi:hypothetical protein
MGLECSLSLAIPRDIVQFLQYLCCVTRLHADLRSGQQHKRFDSPVVMFVLTAPYRHSFIGRVIYGYA